MLLENDTFSELFSFLGQNIGAHEFLGLEEGEMSGRQPGAYVQVVAGLGKGCAGPIASSSDFLEPPRNCRTQISEAWKLALKLLLPNPHLLKSPFRPNLVVGP